MPGCLTGNPYERIEPIQIFFHFTDIIPLPDFRPLLPPILHLLPYMSKAKKSIICCKYLM